MKRIILLLLSCFISASFATQPSLQKVTVALDWAPNTSHAPLIIAQQQGFFKEQGLDVTFIYHKHLTDSSKLITEDKADIGLMYEPWFIEQVDQGQPIIRIGTLIDKPLNCIVALKQSGVKTLADLKDKEIGSSSNRLTRLILTALLEKQGFSAKEIKLVDVKQNLSTALLSHKVTAISGMLRNLEVPKLENTGHHLVVFFPEEHGIPNYSELIFVTNTVHAQDPRFSRFLVAIKQAVRYLDEHPQQAWQQFTKQYPYLNTTLNREYWFATLPYYAEDPASFNSEEWQTFVNFMQKNKLISKIQPLSRYSNVAG